MGALGPKGLTNLLELNGMAIKRDRCGDALKVEVPKVLDGISMCSVGQPVCSVPGCAWDQEPMAKGGIKLHGEGGGLVRALPPAKGLSEAPAECHPKGLGRFGLIRPM